MLQNLIQLGLNQTLELLFCLSMISAQALRVDREGKPVPTFPDHALEHVPIICTHNPHGESNW